MKREMGKGSQYGKRYCKDWEKEDELEDWIRSVPGDESKAACKYCRCDMRAHHADLIAHATTAKHQRCLTIVNFSSNQRQQPCVILLF